MAAEKITLHGKVDEAVAVEYCNRMEKITLHGKQHPENRIPGAVEPWPPQWKSIEECPQHYYIVDFLEPFREKSTDPNTLLFYKQIEETRGYDVTVGPDFYNGYNPFSAEDHPSLIEDQSKWCQAVVQHINEQAKMHGELYEFVEFVKRVYLQYRVRLMTLKVKKVKPEIELKTVQACLRVDSVREWRFKPDE